MSKKKSSTPPESLLLLPSPPSPAGPLVDTHTHILSTYGSYVSKYPNENTRKYGDVYQFVRGMVAGRGDAPTTANPVGLVDVWCEPGVFMHGSWKELADAAVNGTWGEGIEYWFVIGVHPHEAKSYSDEVERVMLEALVHPRCVGLGEIGLDYHYDLSAREVQREIFRRQLRLAVKLGKPITVHTREAEEDMEQILKEEVPKETKIHVHCFTDSPDFAERLLSHFPNLYIGVTGVVTYATNENTQELFRRLVERFYAEQTQPIEEKDVSDAELGKQIRILLETDAPYMVPSNVYDSLVPVPEEEQAESTTTTNSPTPALSSTSKKVVDSSAPTPSETSTGTSTPALASTEASIDPSTLTPLEQERIARKKAKLEGKAAKLEKKLLQQQAKQQQEQQKEQEASAKEQGSEQQQTSLDPKPESPSPSAPASESAPDQQSAKQPRQKKPKQQPKQQPQPAPKPAPKPKPIRLPLCHTGMIPWTAEFVAAVARRAQSDVDAKKAGEGEKENAVEGEPKEEVLNGGNEENADSTPYWTAARIMRLARENARFVYGV